MRIDKEYFFKKWSLNVYVDVQNVLNAKIQEQDFLTNLDENGNPKIDPNDDSRYILRSIPSESGTIVPTIGIIIEF
jgi:hypothetical protein